MWARRSYDLAALTHITSSNVKFKWTKIKQDGFEEIKRIVARNNLLSYLYFNEGFKIHTDASYFQLGEVAIQKGRPINFYSRKITDTQKFYTVA